MKRTIAILTAAMMTTALGSLPALAAGTDHNGGVTGTTNGMSSDNTGAISNGSATSNEMQSDTISSGQDTMSTGSTTSDQSMMSSDQMVAKIKGLQDVSNVKVVTLSDMANTDTKVQEGSTATNTTPEEQQSIQGAIEANPALSSKLQAQSVDVSQVVAADVDANNSVTVFVR